MSQYDDAMQALNAAAYSALRAALEDDGKPVAALRAIASDIDSLIDHGVTRAEMASIKALYEGEKSAGLVEADPMPPQEILKLKGQIR